MTRLRRWIAAGAMLLLSACSLGVPQVTPTAPPTRTLTPTAQATDTTIPTRTPTQTITPTLTITPSPFPSLTPTWTPSLTWTPLFTDTLTPTTTHTPTTAPTATPSPTVTETPSPTFTPTNTDEPTSTPTLTPTATQTTIPSATNTATPTPNTPTVTNTASPTLPPTVTPLPLIEVDTSTPPPSTSTPTLLASATLTEVVTLTFTVPPSLTPLPTPSLLPSLTATLAFVQASPRPEPTVTPSLGFAPPGVRSPTPDQPTPPVPTIDATPTIIFGEVTFTPLMTLPPQEQTAVAGLTSPTAVPPTATPDLPTLPPTFAPLPTLLPGSSPQTRGIALSTTNGFINPQLLPFPFEVRTFARNPANPNEVIAVDPRGLLYIYSNFAEGIYGRFEASPFNQFVPESPQTNDAYVTSVEWSPDGQYFAFLVDTESDPSPDNDSAKDGVWLYSGGTAVQVIHDCPPQAGCGLVEPGGEPHQLRSLDFAWSPASDRLLVNVELPNENRRAFTVVPAVMDGGLASRRGRTFQYEYATWGNDGRVLASGYGPNGFAGIWFVDTSLDAGDQNFEQTLFDARASGLYVRDAVQQPYGDENVLALGAPLAQGGENAAMAIYTAGGQALTPPIGDRAPIRVAWSPDRSAVLVVTVADDGTRRYYVAEVNGSVREITAIVADALAVEWVGSAPPAVSGGASGSGGAAVGEVGVVSAYGITSNVQAQVVNPAGAIVRRQPSVESAPVASVDRYDFVVVRGGPSRSNDGIVWWEVETAQGMIGWIAEAYQGTQILSLEVQP